MCGCFFLFWMGSIIVTVVSAITAAIVASTTDISTSTAFWCSAPVIAALLIVFLMLKHKQSKQNT